MGRKKIGRIPIWATPEPPLPLNRKAVLRKVAVLILATCVLVAAGIAARRVEWRQLAEQALYFARFAGNWRPAFLPSLLFVGTLVILLLWKLPKLQVARSRALTDEKRFDRENEARKTLAQILAGVFVLAGLYSSVQTFDLSREGQITDRFTKAIELLGALDGSGKPKVEVRLGGIYALERIARDSERDYGVIMEFLTTYVRVNSPLTEEGSQEPSKEVPRRLVKASPADFGRRPRADIQAILTVLGRRQGRYGDKNSVNLNLDVTDLRGVVLREANLTKVSLSGADLTKASLIQVDLRGAYLFEVNLIGANLSWAHLNGANLSWAHLNGANLSGANLSGANLVGADLRDADVSEATGLTQMQINDTRCNGETRLPSELRRPDK
jgi:hypothetical protein